MLSRCVRRFMCGIPVPAKPSPSSPSDAALRCAHRGVELRFRFWPNVSQSTLILRRAPVDALPLLGFPLHPIFDWLGVEDVLNLVGCVLTEQQILFVSEDVGKLTHASECILSLAFPFEWQMPYVPVMSRALLDFLHAPTPYIAGLTPDILPYSCDLLRIVLKKKKMGLLIT